MNFIPRCTFLTIIMFLLTSSCAFTPPNPVMEEFQVHYLPTPYKQGSDCIPPITNLAFPLDIPSSLDFEQTQISPLGDWQQIAHLPKSLGKEIPRIASHNNDIWVLSFDTKTVFRYGTDSDEWKTYNTIDSIPSSPRNLFMTEEGTLWGFENWAVDYNGELPFLSKFNPKIDTFEFVNDLDGLFNDDISAISSIMTISQDSQGSFWFFAQSGMDVGLYSFTPATREAEKHISLPLGLIYTGPVVAPDGNIWFYYGGGQGNQIMKYSSSTRETYNYIGLPNLEELGHISYLYLDRENRLWLDIFGWLDFTNPTKPIWYEIIPSAVFVTDNGWFKSTNPEGPGTRYGWLRPFYIFQSSNSWLWFTTVDGTIWLNPEVETWCKFTTGKSPVVEDIGGNVWIVVFDYLYQYSFEE